MLASVKTVESPCRNCQYIDQDKDECAKDCVQLGAFQTALLRRDEINIKNFEFRSPILARRAV